MARRIPLYRFATACVFAGASFAFTQLGPTPPSPAPRQPASDSKALIGITYYVHFGDWDSANSRGESGFCHQAGWGHVQPLIEGRAYCYSSQLPTTGQAHSRELEAIGIDFLLVPVLQESVLKPPFENHEFLGLRALMQSLRKTSRLKVIPVIPLVCRGLTCPNPQPESRELFVWNATQESLLKEILRLFDEDPSLFVIWEKKPVLGFYVGQNEKVLNDGNEIAFRGPQQRTPLPQDFNPSIELKGQAFHLREVFTPRFLLSVSGGDFTKLGPEAWPWTTTRADTVFQEVKLASPYFADDQKDSSPEILRDSMKPKQEPIILIQAWNKHALDETPETQVSIEPTTTRRELYDSLKK